LEEVNYLSSTTHEINGEVENAEGEIVAVTIKKNKQRIVKLFKDPCSFFLLSINEGNDEIHTMIIFFAHKLIHSLLLNLTTSYHQTADLVERTEHLYQAKIAKELFLADYQFSHNLPQFRMTASPY
jgi:hypothetical protein